MTKYSIKMIDGSPCAVADPKGCFYSTGEVDKEILSLKNAMGYCLELEPVRKTDGNQPLS